MKSVIKRFLDFVEIRTKITSTFVFVLSIGLLLYHRQPINWVLTLMFFASMFLFDLTTTAINNYIDTKSNHQVLQFNRKTALMIIYVLFAISAGLGIYLAFTSDIIVFLVGGLCFLCGVFYTYGPVPISRTPLGELLSGIFYGVFIPFLIFYINTPAGTFLTLAYSWEKVSISFEVMPMICLLLLAITPSCVTANIMLANNTCDLEKDIAVRRHTLPYYIGKKNALYLFAGLYYLTYIATTVLVIVKVLSPISLFSLLTIIIVQKNIKVFFKSQDKTSTFVLAVKNYIIIMGANIITIFLSIILS